MTRTDHEEKFRIIRKVARQRSYRWLATPIYQEFLAGERKLPCAPWGSITRNPYGWKGPCYLLTDGIFPTYDALLEGIEWEEYGPGNDPRCEHCGIHSGFEPSAAYTAAGSLKGRGCIARPGPTRWTWRAQSSRAAGRCSAPCAPSPIRRSDRSALSPERSGATDATTGAGSRSPRSGHPARSCVARPTASARST